MTLILYPILIISALLRFHNNTALALWHDEAFSALYMRYPFAEMMHRIGLDVHPPLYYWILRLWTNFAGDSVMSLRLLSIFFGVLTVWAAYSLVQRAFGNKKMALLAAFFIAINPFQIQYALEARMYTLGTFAILMAAYFLVRALSRDSQFVKIKYWLGFMLAVSAAMYTHYYLFFSIAALGLYIIYDAIATRRFKNLIPAIFSGVGAAILYLPWMKTFLEQVSRVTASYWIPPMDRWSVPGTLWKMFFSGQEGRHLVLTITALVSIILVYYFLKRIRSPEKWLIFLGLAVPFTAAVFVSMRTNLYLDRYFVFASLFFSIAVAAAIYKTPRFVSRWGALILISAVTLFAFSKNWQDLEVHNKPGMAAAAEVINLKAHKNDKIMVGSSFIYFTFKYYNTTDLAPQLISDRPLKDIPHFSGTALLTDDDLILDLNKFARGQTVWLLWTTGFGGSKPNLPKNWKQLNETKFGDTPGFKGDIFVTENLVN